MDTEFHYYITALIAKEAGFSEEDAATIAYSSEYVDGNTVAMTVRDPQTGGEFRSNISQTLDIMKPWKELVRIWPVFHFPPGDPTARTACRRDGMMHVMNTTPGCSMADAMLRAAFRAPEDRRPHRIGIATHTFVDTWAHQNFVGAPSEFNNIPGRVLLNIGHLDAGTDPDVVNKRWKDARIVQGNVDNNERFLSAAEALYRAYRRVLRGAVPGWTDCERKLRRLMSQPKRDRNQRYARERSWLPKYKNDAWLREALDDDDMPLAATLGRFKWRTDRRKTETDWYKFQVGVKEHQDLGIHWLKRLYRSSKPQLLSDL